jgi:hypothetical protein
MRASPWYSGPGRLLATPLHHRAQLKANHGGLRPPASLPSVTRGIWKSGRAPRCTHHGGRHSLGLDLHAEAADAFSTCGKCGEPRRVCSTAKVINSVGRVEKVDRAALARRPRTRAIRGRADEVAAAGGAEGEVF